MRITLMFVLFSVFTSLAVASELVVRYPKPESDTDVRSQYAIELLALALQKSGLDTQLKPADKYMGQSRALVSLAESKSVDVAWSMTSIDREKTLLPIRIPIYKGLIGWRIFLYIPANNPKLSADNIVENLKELTLIQGHDWPDTHILRDNGFYVEGVASYHSIFKMMQIKRADLFPRSLSEVWGEYETYKSDGFEIEPQILLHYPAAVYFFVSPTNQLLKEALETGLNRALDDGSFDALFLQYHQPTLTRANLTGRKVIELNNPLLPTMTPLQDKRLWFYPSK